jgi:hypothetical protein
MTLGDRPLRGSAFLRGIAAVAYALTLVAPCEVQAAPLPSRAVAAVSDAILGNPNYVAVVIRIPTPPGISRDQVIAIMKRSVPQFQALPGLVRKYFTISDDNRVGGVYLFVNRAAADAYFTPAWIAGVQKTYGATPDIIYLSSPVQIDGTAG